MRVTAMPDVLQWDQAFSQADQQRALQLVEDGQVLWFNALDFELSEAELDLLSPDVADGTRKNISIDPTSLRVAGSRLEAAALDGLRGFVLRFSQQSRQLVLNLLPRYADQLQTGMASFRPVEIEGRGSSSRKDDTRLHIDAFASRPNQGRRILRMFSNINRSGKPRTWLLGEAFEPYAKRFLPRVRGQLPGEAAVLRALRITKQHRTLYDHVMLGLHDCGKLDDEYQRAAYREQFDFPPGSTWLCFTDQVLHAALGGQHLLEQTFLLPPAALHSAERSPLQVLRRLTGRALV